MKIVITLVSFLITMKGFAQQEIQVLSSFTDQSFGFTTIAEKDINTKWNYFSINEAGADYDYKDNLSFETEHYLSYQFIKNLSFATALSLQNNNILPQIGLCYSIEKNNLDLAVYPTLSYGIADEEFGASLNSVIEYAPRINDKWDFFNLLVLDADYDFDGDIGFQQSLNTGVEWKRKLSFGLNLDFNQYDNFNENDTEYGFFIGYKL